VLTRGLKPVESLDLRARVETVAAPCERRYTTREQFEALLNGDEEWMRMFARDALRLLDEGREVPDHVDYMVQTLWLNRELALIGLDAEPLCGLGRKVEAAVAPKQAMLLGYVNGCVSYVPDAYEQQRGGYEADSYLFETWTGPWENPLEDVLAAGVARDPEELK
jgi:hypothetical protein